MFSFVSHVDKDTFVYACLLRKKKLYVNIMSWLIIVRFIIRTEHGKKISQLTEAFILPPGHPCI